MANSNYELWIEAESKEYKLADLGGEIPAMNYQSNSVADLKTVKFSYSMSIDLPLTQANIEIFGFANVYEAKSNAPYKLFNCRLYENGHTLAGKGAILNIRSIGNTFNCQIKYGNFDLFTTLKDSPMSDLDLGYIERTTNAIQTGGGAYTYGIAAYTKGVSMETKKGQPDLKNIYPFVWLRYVIEGIITNQGYTLSHDLNGYSTGWYDKAFSLASIKPHKSSIGIMPVCTAKVDYNTSLALDYYIPFSIEQDEYGWLYSNGNDSVNTTSGDERYIEYISPVDGFIDVTTSAAVYIDGSIGDINIQNWTKRFIRVPGYVNREIRGFDNDTQTFEVSIGDKIQVLISSFNDNSRSRNIQCNVQFTIKDSQTTPLGGRIDIASNLGFENQFDCFKAYAQLFGLFIDVDYENKIVHTYTANTLYDRIKTDQAKDWSTKMSIGNPNTTFTNKDYAQRNIILLNENTDDNVIDKGIFIIDNENLTKEKELFTLALESGVDIKVKYGDNTYTVANIPIEERTIEDGAELLTYKGSSKSHIVTVSQTKGTIIIDQVGSSIELPLITHATMQSFLDIFYDKLINKMLYRWKLTEREFLLNSQDVAEFSQFTPIYIDSLGKYFFVNKINDYGARKLTTCQLVEL